MRQQRTMSKGKGKEVATKPDWKDQLAMLDQEVGWDEQAGSDWADSCEAESQEVFTPNRPTPRKHGNKKSANNVQSSEQDYTHYEPSDSIQDDEIMSAEMQRTIWEAAVREHGAVAYTEHNTDALDDDDAQEDIYTATRKQQEEEQEHVEVESMLTDDSYHPSGSKFRYEDQHPCHELLCDLAEEGKKRKREYFAQAGETGLIKDPCVLLPYPQDDIPGTEEVDKPVLMVTTPEGETLYPHDMEEYPEPPAASWHGPKIGWGRAPHEGEHVVAYEDEDTPDF